MLYLKPPFHIIEGSAVFADHANERQFYFMPAMPHLSMFSDGGMDIPAIQLLKFRGGAGNGGFLTFQVDLGLPQERIDAIGAELKRIHQLREDPILAPVLLEGGSVRLIILGKATGPDGQPLWDPEQNQRFVVDIEHATTPALYGDNQAVFSVELDQDGVQLIEASLLESALMPIGVVYSLDFYALRPAFTVKVTADWDRVQTHLSESFGVDVMFVSTEIDTVVDKLIEDQVVKIDVDSFLPEGEDSGSWVGRREQAVNDFKDMVLDTFFKPSIEPVKEEKDGWDKFADTSERLAEIGASGGFGFPKFSYVKKDFTRIDKKRIDLTMNERVTVKRSIYPQATLKGLGRALPRDADGKVIDAGRWIQEVTLDDPWFTKRSVRAWSLVDFDEDQVQSVNLTLNYANEPRTIRLTKAEPDATREWNSTLAGNAMVRPVDYEYRVSFGGVDTGERPGFLVWRSDEPIIGDEFDISPRGQGLYFIDHIVFGAAGVPWDRYPQVSVEVRYADPAHSIRLAETFMLSRDKPEATWNRFRLNAQLSDYEVKVTYLAVDREDIAIDWASTDQERFIIRDPHPLRRVIQVAPAVDWRLVAMVFVELRYLDEANDVDEQQTLAFFDSPEDRVPKTFSIDLVDGTQRLVSYATTIVLKDNRTIIVPRSMTVGSTIVIRTDMAGHRIVSVTPPNVDFGARGIARIEAQLSYRDQEAGLDFQDRFTFASPNDAGSFEFDYVSPDRSSYSCVALVVLSNGLVQERDLGSLSVDRLVLPAA